MKVARPPDQEMRDKEGPVCSVQHQTEPVASFVPQKPFHHKANSSILLLLLFPQPLPNSLPTSKRTRLTSDLHSSSSMSFRIKHWVFSFLLLPSSYILFLFPLSHIPVQRRTRRGSFAPPSQHVNAQVVWSTAIAGVKLTVCIQCALFRIKKIVHVICWSMGGHAGNRLQSALWPLRH